MLPRAATVQTLLGWKLTPGSRPPAACTSGLEDGHAEITTTGQGSTGSPGPRTLIFVPAPLYRDAPELAFRLTSAVHRSPPACWAEEGPPSQPESSQPAPTAQLRAAAGQGRVGWATMVFRDPASPVCSGSFSLLSHGPFSHTGQNSSKQLC